MTSLLRYCAILKIHYSDRPFDLRERDFLLNILLYIIFFRTSPEKIQRPMLLVEPLTSKQDGNISRVIAAVQSLMLTLRYLEVQDLQISLTSR